MFKSFALCVAFSLLIMSSTRIMACEPPADVFDATQFPVDVILEGVVRGVNIEADKSFYTVDVSTVQFGVYADKQYSFELGWSCPTSSPDVKVGDRARFYLLAGGEAELSPVAWEFVEEHLKTPELIQLEQGTARFRKYRSENYYEAGGALSRTDPDKWMSPGWISATELTDLRQSGFDVYVTFKVNSFGAIYDCASSHVSDFRFAYLDKRVCEVISKNVKLVPPIFTDERIGFFSWSPPDE